MELLQDELEDTEGAGMYLLWVIFFSKACNKQVKLGNFIYYFM